MSDLTFVKYCPLCGAENPRQQAFCLSCMDGDLSTIPVEQQRKQRAASALETACPPSPVTAAQPEEPRNTRQVCDPDTCVLESLDDPKIRFIITEGQSIGRTNKADVVLCGVPKLDWISGIHAKFLRRGEQWYVQHVGSTNFIKVDGEKYSGSEEVAIFNDSILVLSLTAFRVKFGVE